MKNYAVLEGMKRHQKTVLDDAFNKGYDQGYHDGKLDSKSEKIEELEKQCDEEKKAEYDRGFNEGYERAKLINTDDAYEAGYDKGYEKGKQEILDTIAKSITSLDEIKKAEYDKGYQDACNDKDLITCKKSDEISDKAYKDGYSKGYDKGFDDCEVAKADILKEEYNTGYGAGYKDAYEVGKKDGQKAERMLLHEPLKKDLEEFYQKGLKHGQELRMEEAKCAEACGMRKAWEAAKWIADKKSEQRYEIFALDGYSTIIKAYSPQQAIAKIEAWEQKQTEKSCDTCANLSEENGYTDFCWDECDNRSEWTPKQDATENNAKSIGFGDEVVDNIGNVMMVTYIAVESKCADVLKSDGTTDQMPLEIIEKTGKHYDIQALLDAMKSEKTEEGGE